MTVTPSGPAVMPDQLRTLVEAVELLPFPAFPEPSPQVGQTRAEWLDRVRALRAEHEAYGARAAAAVSADAPAFPPVDVEVRELAVPVPGGTIRARAYVPSAEGPLGLIVSLHGGGWWTGGGDAGLDGASAFHRGICAWTSSVVLDVDYRLAPENPFPVPLEDVYAATTWAAAGHAGLGVDPARVSVLGASAGGNLAAALCLLARDRGGPELRTQVLLAPALDATASSASIDEVAAFVAGPREMVEGSWRLYLGDADPRSPYASPVHALRLHDLPRAHIVVGEWDPLRDEGLRFAERLSADGVEVTLRRVPMTHGVALPETIGPLLFEVAEVLRTAHATTA